MYRTVLNVPVYFQFCVNRRNRKCTISSLSVSRTHDNGIFIDHSIVATQLPCEPFDSPCFLCLLQWACLGHVSLLLMSCPQRSSSLPLKMLEKCSSTKKSSILRILFCGCFGGRALRRSYGQVFVQVSIKIPGGSLLFSDFYPTLWYTGFFVWHNYST